MKVIGHRGSAGTQLENTKASFGAAMATGIDAIELDIRKTRDNQLVVCHDNNLGHISAEPLIIANNSLAKLQSIRLHNGEKLLSLSEALTFVGQTPIIIEIKDTGCARVLLSVLTDFPKVRASVASFRLSELALLREVRPDLDLYGLEQTRPFEVIHMAKVFGLKGIGLNFWLLNPLVYLQASRKGLDVYVYTVNNPLMGRLISTLYPKVAICTDFPSRFIGRLDNNKEKRPKNTPDSTA